MTMEALGHFLLGMVVYGAGPCAIAYMVFRFLGKRQVTPRFFVDRDDDIHTHLGKWVKP